MPKVAWNALVAQEVEDFVAVPAVGAGIERQRDLEAPIAAPFDDLAEPGARIGRRRRPHRLRGRGGGNATDRSFSSYRGRSCRRGHRRHVLREGDAAGGWRSALATGAGYLPCLRSQWGRQGLVEAAPARRPQLPRPRSAPRPPAIPPCSRSSRITAHSSATTKRCGWRGCGLRVSRFLPSCRVAVLPSHVRHPTPDPSYQIPSSSRASSLIMSGDQAGSRRA